MDQQRRRFRNFLKYSKLHRSYYFYVFIGGLLSATVFGMLMMVHLLQIQQAVNEAGLKTETVIGVYDKLYIAALLFFGSFIVYTLLATAIVIYLEGRVGGSSFAILEVIEKYRAGDLEHSRNLRLNDELQPVMDALKALAKDLREKK